MRSLALHVCLCLGLVSASTAAQETKEAVYPREFVKPTKPSMYVAPESWPSTFQVLQKTG